MDSKKKGFFRRHKILSILGGLIILIIIIVVATGGGNKPTVNTTASDSTTNTKASGSSSTTATVGSTVEIGGSKGLAVTLVQVIDPATASDSDLSANAGNRYIAVDIKIVNNGTSAYSDDANSDLSLIGTDNQTYTADFDTVSECTNFNSGQYTLAPGESTTGCVVYQVPDGVNTAKIQFTTDSGLSSNTGEWKVN